jgi:CubicO group peptidase (beta-lactamase class C family)
MADRLAGLQPGAYIGVSLAIAIGLIGGGSGRLGGETVDSSVAAKIDGVFSSAIAPDGPGAAVLVRRGGQDVFVRGYGLRELRTKTAIDARTNFRLASCTKQFTAMAIMLLVHDGKLRYDEKLTEVFTKFPDYGKSITISNLLNHTAGLPDYEEFMLAAEPLRNSWVWSEARQIRDSEVLTLLEQQKAGKFAAGTKWAYSNSGYVVLGLVVAKVSGKSFGEFLRQRIFAPLGMDGTLAYENEKNEVAHRAYGHSRDSIAWKQTDQSSTSATLGDGGIYSSVTDLAKWDEALGRQTLLSESEMQVGITSARLSGGAPPRWPRDSDRPEGTLVAYGFGWFLDPYRGHARMWHYGDTRGFHTYIERFVDDRVTIVVLCNRADLDPEILAAKVSDLLFR